MKNFSDAATILAIFLGIGGCTALCNLGDAAKIRAEAELEAVKQRGKIESIQRALDTTTNP